MAVKVKLGGNGAATRARRTAAHPIVRWLAICLLVSVVVGAGIFGYF
jgi:hypothetical protein